MPTQALTLFKTIFTPNDLILYRPIANPTGQGRRQGSPVDRKGIRHLLLGSQDNKGNWRFDEDSICRAITWQLERSSQRLTNVFFGVCPRYAPRYDQAWQIRIVRCFWADLDNCVPDTALERCELAGLPKPTAVVNSGYGVHLYWKLAEPFYIDDAGEPPQILFAKVEATDTAPSYWRKYIKGPNGEELDLPAHEPDVSPKGRQAEAIMKGITKLIRGDSTQDLARILRLPGSWNRKDKHGQGPVPCELVECDGQRTYAIEQFLPFISTERTVTKEELAAVPLPACESLTPKQLERFAKRLLASQTTPKGQRSEVDSSLCITAIQVGMGKEAVWQQVQGIGKFAEAGRRYFDTTWDDAETKVRRDLWLLDLVVEENERSPESVSQGSVGRPLPDSEPLANTRLDWENDEKGKKKPIIDPLMMRHVVAEILLRTGGWPKRIGTELFVHYPGRAVRWINDTASLFGYLQAECGIVEWTRCKGCVTKEETFAELRNAAEDFDAIEEMPHEPVIARHYYTTPAPGPGPGETLDRLLAFFCPESEIDAALLKAAFVAPLWGGPPGTRPAFMFTAETGRGKGKSTLAQMITRFYGGSIDISAAEDIATIKTRILSRSAATKRIGLLDNVKTTRFSWAELEALITSTTISGRALYIGDAGRPNLFTWLITLNGASLSTDMAQRVVEIRLTDPVYDGDWETKVTAFMDDNRDAIFAGMVAFLRQPTRQLRRHSRWSVWERDVLSRIDVADDCIDVLITRRGEVDVEEEVAGDIEAYFQGKLEWLGYDIDRNDIFIPNSVMTYWYNKATGGRERTSAIKRAIKQMFQEKKLTRLRDYRNKKHRGARWIGYHVLLDERLQYDLAHRLKAKLSDQEWSLLGIELDQGDSDE
jgi:hypothetical protein